MNVDSPQLGHDLEAVRASLPETLARHYSALRDRYPLALQSFLSIFDQAIVSGTSFLSAVLIGRATSPTELGRYYLVLSVVLVINGAQEQIVAAPYLVYSKQRRGRELTEYTGSMWLQQLAIALLTIAGLFAVIIMVSLTGPSELFPGLWALLFATPLLLLRQAARRYTFAQLQLISAIGLDGAVAVLQLGGLMLLIYFERLTLVAIFAVMSGACALAFAGWYLLNPPRVRIVRGRFLPDLCRNWSFGKWALQGYVVGQTTPQVMLWILGLTGGAAATGVLGACATVVGIMNVLLFGFDNVLTPQVAHVYAAGKRDEVRRILARAAAFLSVTFGSVCAIVFLAGGRIMIVAFGPEYLGTGAILFVLALNSLMAGLGMVFGSGLRAIDKPRLNLAADVVCMIVSLVSAAILIVPYGALGAAFAMLAGTSTSAIVRIVIFTKNLDLVPPDSSPAPDPHPRPRALMPAALALDPSCADVPDLPAPSYPH
jgi:O-antigen/teichoic acid export membrane protein